jgi:hypothetical protein
MMTQGKPTNKQRKSRATSKEEAAQPAPLIRATVRSPLEVLSPFSTPSGPLQACISVPSPNAGAGGWGGKGFVKYLFDIALELPHHTALDTSKGPQRRSGTRLDNVGGVRTC